MQISGIWGDLLQGGSKRDRVRSALALRDSHRETHRGKVPEIQWDRDQKKGQKSSETCSFFRCLRTCLHPWHSARRWTQWLTDRQKQLIGRCVSDGLFGRSKCLLMKKKKKKTKRRKKRKEKNVWHSLCFSCLDVTRQTVTRSCKT